MFGVFWSVTAHGEQCSADNVRDKNSYQFDTTTTPDRRRKKPEK
jgi:hypothetical protein